MITRGAGSHSILKRLLGHTNPFWRGLLRSLDADIQNSVSGCRGDSLTVHINWQSPAFLIVSVFERLRNHFLVFSELGDERLATSDSTWSSTVSSTSSMQRREARLSGGKLMLTLRCQCLVGEQAIGRLQFDCQRSVSLTRAREAVGR